MTFYFAKDGKEHGPYTGNRLAELAKTGIFGPDDLVRQENGGFIRASRVRGLVFGQSPSNGSLPPPLRTHAIACRPIRRTRAFVTAQESKNQQHPPSSSPAAAVAVNGQTNVFDFLVLACMVFGVWSAGSWLLTAGGCGARRSGTSSVSTQAPQRQGSGLSATHPEVLRRMKAEMERLNTETNRIMDRADAYSRAVDGRATIRPLR